LHLFLAKSSKIEELKLSPDEAKELGDAVLRVTELYEIPIPSEKVMAWIMLGKTAADVYGPRIAAHEIRKAMKPKVVEGNFRRTEKEEPQQRQAAPAAPPSNPALFEDA